MSKKDTIERANRSQAPSTPPRPPVRPAAAPVGTSARSDDAREEVTRINNGTVVRRRRVEDAPSPGPAPAPTSSGTSAAPVRAASGPQRPAPPPPPPPAPAVRQVIRRPGPNTAAAAVPAPTRPAEPVVEAAPVEPVVEVLAPAPEPEAPPAAAVVESAPVIEVAPVVEIAPAPPAPVEVAAPAPEPAPVVEAPAIVVEAPAPAAAVDAPAAPAADAGRAARPQPRMDGPRIGVRSEADPARAAAAASLVSGLPRADGSRAAGRRPTVAGLGLGVIAPPPGYDPNDAAGNRRRAAEAAAAARADRGRPTGPAAGGRWPDRGPGADGAAPPPPAGTEEERRDRARGKRNDRGGRVEMLMQDVSGMNRRRGKPGRGAPVEAPRGAPQSKAIKRRVEFNGSITVSQLAHGMSVKASQIIKTLLGMGQMATANDALDFDTAQLIATEFEYEVVNATFDEKVHMIKFEETAEAMRPRPPIVTIMGHVDHGKTSLLDAIRNANVAAGEAGGITQHVSAYQVSRGDNKITFVDTPGHAAFTAMRARGAQMTDIVVLVVAGDDGVMPQTIEVVNHVKAANVQLLVAINKCDKPEFRPDRVKQQLMEHGIVPEEYGGETIFVNVSAMKKIGINDLLDSILLVSEVANLQANPERHAEGTVIEARIERGKGAVATVLVQQGTLRKSDRVVLGTVWGRVRAMTDDQGRQIKEALPATPVDIMGLEDLPQAGDNFVVVESEKDAKALVEHRLEQARLKAAASTTRVTLEDLVARGKAGEIVQLNLILKADVSGSMEAIQGAIRQVNVPGTEIKVLHSGVGAVTESDVMLAHTNEAVIIAFNVRPDAQARKIMDGYGVQVRTYKVIYEALEDIEKSLKGLLAPTIEEKVQGTAEVRQTFTVPKVGTVAGCMVTDGKIARSNSIRLLRDGTIVWEGRLASLKRFKDDVREVSQGYECGMGLDGFNDIKLGDVIEAYTREEVAVV